MGLIKSIKDVFTKVKQNDSGSTEIYAKEAVTHKQKIVINGKEYNSVEDLPAQYRGLLEGAVKGSKTPGSSGGFKTRAEQVITKYEIDPETGAQREISREKKVLKASE